MTVSRRQLLKHASCACVGLSMFDLFRAGGAQAATDQGRPLGDRLFVLPPQAVRLDGHLDRYIRLSIRAWAKGVLPYKALVQFFRTGRPDAEYNGQKFYLFAAGEMWGKAVRSAALFYRYTGDLELRQILKATVTDLLSTRRENGTISCAPVAEQPDGPGGDLWERKYVLLGLDEYYRWVDQDPKVLRAMIEQADATIAQVGLPPKKRIVDLGWSAALVGGNNIESSTILEPILRLYEHTGYTRYLDFARYIVETEGGARRHHLIDEVLSELDPVEIGGVYPKAYEMLSFFEGLVEYYRATENERWRRASLSLFQKVIEKEITIIGNGGGDYPYHPNVGGEAWNNSALEQTNPGVKRMMETCVGVTWMKFCHQLLRLTADPLAVDYIELYAYNGLIGAMKPQGDGFSYVNLLNGVKTNPQGWGGTIAGVYVTCCNLNGPAGLAYLPLIAVMRDGEGPVVNLYDSGNVSFIEGAAGKVRLDIETSYPREGAIRIKVSPESPRRFAIKLRIPAWSAATTLQVNGESVAVQAGSYARVDRRWAAGDVIDLHMDMRCRHLKAKKGISYNSDRFCALMRGPIVLARDENIDSKFDEPVDIVANDDIVEVKAVKPARADVSVQFEVPVQGGTIQMVDYASVNSWAGKKVQTWLPMASSI